MLRFTRQRNKVNNIKKYAKGIYLNNIENAVGNQDTGYADKTFWQVMGRCMGKEGSSVSIPGNNSYARTNCEKADALNEFFSSISTMDDRNVPIPNFEKRTDAILENLDINIPEVVFVLQSLRVNPASILYKSTAGRYRPVSYPDGPIMAHYRFM